MTDVERTPGTTLRRAYKIAQEEGLKYVYVGNIDDEDHTSTYCPTCHERVIDRGGHIGQYVRKMLDAEGRCHYCGYQLEGV